MKIIDNILNEDATKLTYKERQLIVDYFRKLVHDEFDNFKNIFLQKSKEEIFERAEKAMDFLLSKHKKGEKYGQNSVCVLPATCGNFGMGSRI